jgi:hypothetical protein
MNGRSRDADIAGAIHALSLQSMAALTGYFSSALGA